MLNNLVVKGLKRTRHFNPCVFTAELFVSTFHSFAAEIANPIPS